VITTPQTICILTVEPVAVVIVPITYDNVTSYLKMSNLISDVWHVAIITMLTIVAMMGHS